MTPGTAVGTESMTELIFIRTKEILCFNIEFFSRFSPAATSKKNLCCCILIILGYCRYTVMTVYQLSIYAVVFHVDRLCK